MRIALLFLSLITLVRGNIFKNILSDRVHTYLRDQYKDNPTKCECMIEYFRLINIWEKFYSEDILGQQRKLVRDLRPYIEDADNSKKKQNSHPNYAFRIILIQIFILHFTKFTECTVVAFYESPWGIFVTVLAVISAAVIALFIYPRGRRKKTNKGIKSQQRPKFRKPKRPRPMLYNQLPTKTQSN